MVLLSAANEGTEVIHVHFVSKEPSQYTEPEKEKIFLDNELQLIIIKSLDNVMYNNIFSLRLPNRYGKRLRYPVNKQKG